MILYPIDGIMAAPSFNFLLTDQVAGPDEPEVGFIRDFLDETNRYCGVSLIVGDVIKLNNVSCDGFVTNDVKLLPFYREDRTLLEGSTDEYRPGFRDFEANPMIAGRAFITFSSVHHNDADSSSCSNSGSGSGSSSDSCSSSGSSSGSGSDSGSGTGSGSGSDVGAGLNASTGAAAGGVPTIGSGSVPGLPANTEQPGDSASGPSHQPITAAALPPQRVKIDGIEAADSDDSVSISFAPDDVHASSISRDAITGAFTLDVLILTYETLGSEKDALSNFTGLFLLLDDGDWTHVSSEFIAPVWDKYETIVSDPMSIEGVCVKDGEISGPLADLINLQISNLALNEPVDWHPGSNNCVRDLVHPSMYCYVNGESPLNSAGERVLARIKSYNEEMTSNFNNPLRTSNTSTDLVTSLDRWGRLFEASKFQWLPSIFHVTNDGRVTIQGYINNLDRSKYEGLYASLARLFEAFVPKFDAVYNYVTGLRFLPEEEDDLIVVSNTFNADRPKVTLRGTDVRVITKIVDYELADGDKVDGVFHVEGMSSDHILMTGIYVVDRDADFHGGDLIFRRAFLEIEGSALLNEIEQCRHWDADRIVENGLRPLGCLETSRGRMIAFPNSHVHKLSVMTRLPAVPAVNAGRKGISRRRVIVFWVVDPDRDVLTTQEVPRQQSIMSFETACRHRLELMEERKLHKGKLNGERALSLCEH